MRKLLEHEGYEVETLLDQKATGAALLKSLSDAAKATKPGDTFFFYYSGHGGSVKDQGNDTEDEQDDGQDETLCLYDGEVRDDELNKIWKSFPKGSVIFMISDSCHSGTNYKALGLAAHVRPVDFLKDFKSGGMKAALLHIGGCKDPQTSQGESDGGRFTKLLVSIWDDGRYNGTWDTLHDLLAHRLPTNQQPQGNLYGPAKDAEPLGARRPFQPLSNGSAARSERARKSADAQPAIPTLEQLARSNTARSSSARGSKEGPSAGAPPAAVATSSLDVLGLPGSKCFILNVQQRLAAFGLYDALAIDGSPGPFTNWALGEFKIMAGTKDEPGVGPRTADALVNAKPDDLFPLDDSGSSLAARAVRLLRAQGCWLSRHPDTVNIVYLEGVDSDGKINDDRPNVFNDLRMLIRVEQGKVKLAGCWEGTTEPGKHWTEEGISEHAKKYGAARIAFGQYYAWSVGDYHGVDALRQSGDIMVCRDLNKDYERTGDMRETGNFAIHHHGGYDYPVSDLRRSSAGCLVGRTMSGHEDFMSLVKRDARHRASSGYRFTTTVMDGTQLP